jgi:hypothetical protein
MELDVIDVPVGALASAAAIAVFDLYQRPLGRRRISPDHSPDDRGHRSWASKVARLAARDPFRIDGDDGNAMMTKAGLFGCREVRARARRFRALSSSRGGRAAQMMRAMRR